jgi:hypothetical protein
LPANDFPVIVEIDKGKDVMLTNIITGYQKSLRGLLSPFRQMQSAFDKDCIFADHIFVVGYSLGDEHINQSIKTALRYNKNVKLIIIDKYAKCASIEGKILEHFHPIIRDYDNDNRFPDLGTKTSTYNERIIAHSVEFSDFLKDESLHDLGIVSVPKIRTV